MAIDYDNDDVYWLVKKLNGASLLYRTHIDSAIDVSLVNEITPNARGIHAQLFFKCDYVNTVCCTSVN